MTKNHIDYGGALRHYGIPGMRRGIRKVKPVVDSGTVGGGCLE